MRKLVLLCSMLVMAMLVATSLFAQDRGRQRQRPPNTPSQGRAVPREQPRPHPMPQPPPQRYDRNRKSYQHQYYYGDRWYGQRPHPYEYRFPHYRGIRITVCYPEYWAFVGYDYLGRPMYDWVPEYCY